MAILDIREAGACSITEIAFSDRNLIKKESFWVTIKDSGNGREVSIEINNIPDLIKALQKAVELGWTSTECSSVTNQTRAGGPAFPVWELNGQGKPEMTGFGMTLRDYFAARAMQSLLATIDTYPDEHWRDGLAMDAYMMADAMLRAREVAA